MGKDDIADTSLIFSEADIFVITGYLAEKWGIPNDDIVSDTEEAIQVAIQYNDKLEEESK